MMSSMRRWLVPTIMAMTNLTTAPQLLIPITLRVPMG